MKYLIKVLMSYIQFPILLFSYFLYAYVVREKKKKGIVIGVAEISSVLFLLGRAIKNSTTVCLDKNFFYDFKYDFFLDEKKHYLKYFFRFFYGPWLLGFLASRNDVFYYVWNAGFLFNRDADFMFLKLLGKKIIVQFLGDDVRSLVLSKSFGKEQGIDVFANYYGSINSYYETTSYDKYKKAIAKSSDQYADVVFNYKIDQMSYLKSREYSPAFVCDTTLFNKKNDSFFSGIKIKILHAPSNPIIKGTPLVRAAIKKLESEGYCFDYVELQGVSNKVVHEHLHSSHIVLNQFYAFTGGVFGIESLANHCAVLMSADPDIETGLPQDAKGAWMITKYWQVYDNLKYLLDNPEEIKRYADVGYEFAYNHYTYEKASEYLHKVFEENGIVL